MPTEINRLWVRSPRPPTVEVDSEAGAFYVRFKRAKVAQTLVRSTKHVHIAVDLDERGEVVGVESVGCREMSIAQILKKADVETRGVDFSRARIVPADLVPV